uniref:HMG box domain-containing protein n=1 Tax=Megaselia scalaris TaxID=36166 RepID=T1GIL1_MEGSC
MELKKMMESDGAEDVLHIDEEENDAEDEGGKDTTIDGEASVNDNSVPKRKRGTKQKFKVKRRKIKEVGAPKMPLTGYVRFMNFRKESIRSDFPNKQLKEYIKLIGDEWNNLPADQKNKYLEEAEEDKARYNRELEEFFASRPDILAEEIARNKMSQKKAPQTLVSTEKVEKDKPKQITEKPSTKPVPSTSLPAHQNLKLQNQCLLP